MSSIPVEFSEKAITAGSENAATPYRDFIRSREPYRSLLEANPWMAAPKSGEPLAWGRRTLLRHHCRAKAPLLERHLIAPTD